MAQAMSAVMMTPTGPMLPSQKVFSSSTSPPGTIADAEGLLTVVGGFSETGIGLDTEGLPGPPRNESRVGSDPIAWGFGVGVDGEGDFAGAAGGGGAACVGFGFGSALT